MNKSTKKQDQMGQWGPGGSKGRPEGSQGVKGEVKGVPQNQRQHLMGPLMIC